MKTIISVMIAFICYSFSAKAQTVDTVKTATIKVKGISCNGDMPLIKKKLLNEEGIDEITFTEAKSGAVTFTIKYHTAFISEKQLQTAIEKAPSCDDPNDFPYKVKSINSQPLKK